MAASELPSESSDALAFPCWDDDDGAPTALSPPVVISVLASILERHIARNERALAAAAPGDDAGADADDSAATRKRVRAFDSGTALDMSLHAFLERFSRYAHVPPQVYVVAYAYLDRLRRGDAGVRVVRGNAQRLLTAAILVASKFVEDRNYSNAHFAAVGGLAPAELAALELHLLFLLQFRLHVCAHFAAVGGLAPAELAALELHLLFLLQFRLHVCAGVFRSYCRHLEREVSHGGWYRVQRPPLDRALVCGAAGGEARAQHRQAAAA